MTISRLATEPGSPGKAFKLTEAALAQLLFSAAGSYEQISMTSQAGVAQLAIEDDAAVSATELLWDHYRGLVGRARFPGASLLADDGTPLVRSARKGRDAAAD